MRQGIFISKGSNGLGGRRAGAELNYLQHGTGTVVTGVLFNGDGGGKLYPLTVFKIAAAVAYGNETREGYIVGTAGHHLATDNEFVLFKVFA